jgi:hypothetical protein
MQIFVEAGALAFVSLALFVMGLVARARGQAVDAWVMGILAAGAVGVGLGQRLVANAVDATTDLAVKVELLNVGTREVSANSLIAGVFAAVLVVIGRLRA